MAQMTTQAMNDLPDSAFAYIEPGGSKDAEGKTMPRSKRHFPLVDAEHVRAALAMASRSPFGDKAMPKIVAAAKKLGIETGDQSRADTAWVGPQLFMRSYPLEDIRILSRAQGGEYADGRTVEAYVAMFETPAEITDGQGHYMEIIDRAAFNKAINDARPQGGRSMWRTGVFYNHGMTLHGTPSDKFSVPLGSPVEIRVEDRGLLTVTRYNKTALADEVLEAITSGDITGHSFTGRIVRSNPQQPTSRRYGYQRDSNGALTQVRRLELGLREYGPTPFPAYVDTAVVGVRSMLASLPAFLSATRMTDPIPGGLDEEAGEVEDIDEPAGSDTPATDEVVEGAVTDEPPTTPTPEGAGSEEEHSSRSSLLQRIAAAKTVRPGLGRGPSDEARRSRITAITGPERNPE